VLDFGEGLLDGIEVRRIGRQEQKPGPGLLDGLPDRLALVTAEIVHDHDVAGFENRRQLLFGIGQETLAIDRAIEDARSGEPVQAQRADEGQPAPMPMRGIGTKALALRPSAAQGSHVGFDPGLVDKDELLGIKARPPELPAPAPPRDVRARLFKGELRFF
jgi:hypothetical protein